MWQTKCKIVACILYFLIILPIYFIVLLFSWTSTVMYHVCRSSTFIACIFFGSSLYLWYGCKHKKDLARLSTFFSKPHNFLVLVSHFYSFAHWYLMPLFLFFQAPWFFSTGYPLLLNSSQALKVWPTLSLGWVAIRPF